MASRPGEVPAGAAADGLSVATAHFYARVYGVAKAGCMDELRRARCGEEEAEDIFAETFERIMGKLDPPSEGFGPAQTVRLLKKACRQRLIDEHRHRGALGVVPLSEASDRLDETAETPQELAEEREAIAIGREAISALPERDRQLFLQRHRLDLSPEEILRRHPGLSRRTYRKIMQRANARALDAFEQIRSGERCAEMRAERLRRYVAEEASEDELRLIGAHLRRCHACRLAVARMRGHLHGVAAGLAFSAGQARDGTLVDHLARLLEVAGNGGEAALDATRAARERLREIAIRVATGLPGQGGEGAAGQIAGISGAKAASVCAGAVAAGCLAAGVVPGVGGLEEAGSKQGTRPAGSTSSGQSLPVRHSPARASTAGSRSSRGDRAKTSSKRPTGQDKHSTPPPSASARSTHPTISGQQTGTEFGAEAAGTATPVPRFSDGSAGSSGASSGQGTASGSDSTGSSGGGSAGGSEFGL